MLVKLTPGCYLDWQRMGRSVVQSWSLSILFRSFVIRPHLQFVSIQTKSLFIKPRICYFFTKWLKPFLYRKSINKQDKKGQSLKSINYHVPLAPVSGHWLILTNRSRTLVKNRDTKFKSHSGPKWYVFTHCIYQENKLKAQHFGPSGPN